MTNHETHEERVARVRRCWEHCKTSKERIPSYWSDEVRKEAIELGIIQIPRTGRGRDESQPDYEAMIMQRHEDYYNSL